MFKRSLVLGAITLSAMLFAVPASLASAVTPTDLHNYWKLDDGSGSSAVDSQGASNGSWTGTPGWGNDGSVFGDAVFNGSSTIDTHTTMANGVGTISFWAKPTSLNDWQSPVGVKLLGATNGYALVDDSSSGSGYDWRLAFRGNNSGNGEVDVQSNIPAQVNVWTFLAYSSTYNTGTGSFDLNFYVNGALAGSTSYSGTIGSGGLGNLHIGNSGDYPDNYFAGKVDDVRYYTTTLSSQNIADIYSNYMPRPTVGTPAMNGQYSSNSVPVSFLIQSQPAAGSLKLVFSGIVSRTVTVATTGAGNYNFTIDPSNPTISPNITAITGGPTIPNGTYQVRLQYADNYTGLTMNSDLATGVVLGATTTSSPTNTSAASGSVATLTNTGVQLAAASLLALMISVAAVAVRFGSFHKHPIR